MDTAISPASSIATATDRLAAGNLRANLAVMGPEWVEIVGAEPVDVEWVFGRDGYLTARISGSWWSGCSVPLRTGRELLKLLELKGSVGCFLHPTHAGQIRACFEKLRAGQAIIAVVPDVESLRMILRCDDFSREIGASRLFFVSGKDWAEQLGRLFERYPGMPLPQQFVRTALLEDADMNLLTEDAQAVISRETTRRSERLPGVLARAEKRERNGRVLVLAGSQFNLGDLSNVALRAALLSDGGDSSFVAFDPDHPLTASPLALAEAAAEADAVVAADVFRSDLPGIVSPRTAWITWVTSGRIISPMNLGSDDALMLADARWLEPAMKAGWTAERVGIAGWPRIAAANSGTMGAVGVFADTCAIAVPQRVKDFSSQVLLWEMIEDELSNDPLSLGEDARKYLQARMERFNIADEGFDRNLFMERLIVPGYQQGICRLVMRHGISVNLFGSGWGDIVEFKDCAMGAIGSAGKLELSVFKCQVVLDVFPEGRAWMDALPVTVIRPAGLSSNQLLNGIRQGLSSKPQQRQAAMPILGRNEIRSFIPLRDSIC
jgi:hypothetical protein